MLYFAIFALLIQTGAFEYEGGDYKLVDPDNLLLKFTFVADRQVPQSEWKTSCSQAGNVDPRVIPIEGVLAWTKCPEQVELVARMDMLVLMNHKFQFLEIDVVYRSQMIHLAKGEIYHASRTFLRYKDDPIVGINATESPPRNRLDITQSNIEDYASELSSPGEGMEIIFQMQNPVFRKFVLQYPGEEVDFFHLLADPSDPNTHRRMVVGNAVNSGWRVNEVKWTAKARVPGMDINYLLFNLHSHAEAEIKGCECVEKGIGNMIGYEDIVVDKCRKELKKGDEYWVKMLPYARLSDCYRNMKIVTVEVKPPKDEL